jgi:DNA-binding response OmpR family regulator
MSDKIRVIYIEDDDMEAMLFKLGLEKRGLEVMHIPGTTVENLSLLQQPEYQAAVAVFLDMWVGVVNGMELASMLRKQGDTRPMFLLTAGDNPNPTVLRQMSLTFLQKPVDYTKLAQTIKTLV